MVAAASPQPKRPRKLAWLQPAVVVGSLVPFVAIAFRAATGALGANPIATALNQLGLLALIFLIATLSCTPLKILFGLKWPIRVRKTLGLFAFFAALLHFLVYFVVDQGLAWPVVVEDVVGRPFILVGFLALVLLTPLAWTSRKAALQRMGPKRWKRLHRLVYVCGALGVVHFYLRVKQDTTEPIVYGSVLAALLAVRLVPVVRRRRAAARKH